MAPKIATSVVQTGPNDDVVAVDAYATTPSAVEEKLAVEPTLTDNALSALSDVSVDAKDISKMISFNGGEAGLDSDKVKEVLKTNVIAATVGNGDAAKRINRAAGRSISSIPGLDADIMNVAESLMPGLLSGETGELIGNAGDVIKIGIDADTSSASGLIGAIKSLTGNSAIGEYLDTSAEMAAAMAYLDAAVELGIPSMIDELLEKYDKDKRLKEKLIRNVRSVIARSDMDTLDKIIDWIGPEGVLVRVPEACSLLLSSYRFPRKTKPTEYPTKRGELLSMLARLDPNWDKENRAGVETSYLKPFFRLSSTAKMLLLLSPGYETQVLIASKYAPVDLGALARKDFPRMRAWV